MGSNLDNLSKNQLGILCEIGNIGAGNAATSLSKMLGQKVEMNVPAIKILEFKRIQDIIGQPEIPVVGVYLGIRGDVSGSVMFIIEKEESYGLAEIFMRELYNKNRVFDDMMLSAFKEIGNILASSYLSALSIITGLKVVPSSPEISVDMAAAILSVPAIEFGKTGDDALFIETEFYQNGKRVSGYFFLIPDVNSYDKILNFSGV